MQTCFGLSVIPGEGQRIPARRVCLRLGLTLVLAALAGRSFALGLPSCVDTNPSPGAFTITQDKTVTTIVVDAVEEPGVVRAAGDLRTDIGRVAGQPPEIEYTDRRLGTNTILVGTLGQSPALDRLLRERHIDVTPIAGKWESFLIQVVPTPWPGITNALIIVGSDKRGTIYGVYELSEQIGVSPWYWWADAPVPRRETLFVKAGRYIQGPPAVKYRGIFLNDEAPDLTGWVKEKFGNYNHHFYTNVFELLLRLKANYLWPAMWDNCFNEDDPLNPLLADEYGIVMGTSHVEPMMRADKEWNRKGFSAAQWNYDQNPEALRAFWTEGLQRNRPYENLITIAMRGKIDTPMSETANIALLERIVTDQRQIIADVCHTNAAAVPQLWALYKEVQEYYEKGMRVPDDVTLLWCDDNWGNLRRLPTPDERKRAGGAGVYYHFDYVGGPRNYKWLNSVVISKVWEQMNLAYHYGADRVWIVNVGHLQHVTFPTEFFLTLAWRPEGWTPQRVADYTELWAAREFGPEHAAEISGLISGYTKFNARRKPELLEPGTFSLVDYQEAERVLADWQALRQQADALAQALPGRARPCFYELVQFPVTACANLNELYTAAARNRLYAAQRRASANDQAARVRALFHEDEVLSDDYNHKLMDGKWDHMMDQTHIGYSSWQQPRRNSPPAVQEVEVPAAAEMGIAIEGSAAAWPGATNEAVLPAFDAFNQPRRFIDVFNRGKAPFAFSATSSVPWLVLSATNGTVEKEQRLWASVDWGQAPAGAASGSVHLAGAGAESVAVKVACLNPVTPTRESLKGFVEADGYVSLEAEHYSKKVDARNARWERIPGLGRTLSSMSIFPVTASSVAPPADSPCLEYQVYLFHTGAVEVTSMVAPSLNIAPNRGLQFAVSFDDETPQVITAVPKGFFVDNGNRDWEESVKNSCRALKSRHTIAQPGYHVLKVWMVDPGVVLEKLVIDTGGLKPSYLGPRESFHRL